ISGKVEGLLREADATIADDVVDDHQILGRGGREDRREVARAVGGSGIETTVVDLVARENGILGHAHRRGVAPRVGNDVVGKVDEGVVLAVPELAGRRPATEAVIGYPLSVRLAARALEGQDGPARRGRARGRTGRCIEEYSVDVEVRPGDRHKPGARA